MIAVQLESTDVRFPVKVRERLGEGRLQRLHALGNLDLLQVRTTGLFCSVHCPGHAILKTYDQAARWRDEGCCVIGGFHSPIETECLRILLRGTQPVIVCPARALPKRIPPAYRKPLSDGRMLMLSGFDGCARRNSRKRAIERNDLVSAMSDEVFFAHITPGGQLARLTERLLNWAVPFDMIH
jgi:hypothetical protein